MHRDQKQVARIGNGHDIQLLEHPGGLGLDGRIPRLIGLDVVSLAPEVLRSGVHGAIARWRLAQQARQQ